MTFPTGSFCNYKSGIYKLPIRLPKPHVHLTVMMRMLRYFQHGNKLIWIGIWVSIKIIKMKGKNVCNYILFSIWSPNNEFHVIFVLFLLLTGSAYRSWLTWHGETWLDCCRDLLPGCFPNEVYLFIYLCLHVPTPTLSTTNVREKIHRQQGRRKVSWSCIG